MRLSCTYGCTVRNSVENENEHVSKKSILKTYLSKVVTFTVRNRHKKNNICDNNLNNLSLHFSLMFTKLENSRKK